MQPLKELAKGRYKRLVPLAWNSASFVSSLKLLYKETPDSDRILKSIAVQVAWEHMKELINRGDFAALCKEIGEISFDVLKVSLTAKPTACVLC